MRSTKYTNRASFMKHVFRKHPELGGARDRMPTGPEPEPPLQPYLPVPIVRGLDHVTKKNTAPKAAAGAVNWVMNQVGNALCNRVYMCSSTTPCLFCSFVLSPCFVCFNVACGREFIDFAASRHQRIPPLDLNECIQPCMAADMVLAI